ncbi:hypothetical protein DFQ01_11746 [Paenibacillus cellulosilyticus]|uniref:Uncharacterized protein n=1 Tax=Paenibacillus cellulosilyticus TaxID=375489 RepID=A0A2V2YQ27_9BACL|nr:hypothetical protein [Paenibacillus cellulosilyticus]PWV98536.1 hypothetical protein DFQ01_11746 [Paenibacillus cellulosilyticus]QKS44142.1 hypothetical protein HUB94_06630 [Paenibacillus cellulosilyticus]
MSIIKLQGVELVQAPMTKCKTCKGLLTVRKLEVQYVSSQRKDHTAYLPADVWYCQQCDKGYAWDAFKTVMDSSNRSWRIVELSAVSKNAVSAASKSQRQPQPQQVPGAVTAQLDAVDYIIADQARYCVNCGGALIKQAVTLRLSNEQQAFYIPCEILQCGTCQRWQMRRHHYMSLSASHSPHVIQVVHHDRVYESLAHLVHRQGAAGQPAAGDPSLSGQAAKTNKQFNKYGVFIPAPTNKKGYFDE